MIKKIIILFCSLACCSAISAQLSPEKLASLSQHSYWLKLGHYMSEGNGSWLSKVDDPRFFLSKQGKTSPELELTRTLHAFHSVEFSKIEREQIRCKFPARYLWLKQQFETTNEQSESQLKWPALNCPELTYWKTAIDPQGITLVFPTAFMNSASSMFGHTLLRIDAKDKTRGKDLVAFAVNFAAEPDENDNAAMYALKGIIGQYPGKFTVMPYYKKVREYSDIESRDIWEYQLNFNEQEVDKILLHLWELQQATFDYYFIDENCSYQLLSLLQLGRENLDLTSGFSFNVIPSDTVAVLRDNQLLQPPKYRPAFGTKLFHYSQQLSDQQLLLAQKLMKNHDLDISHYNQAEQAAVLEMAYEWLNFNFNDKGLGRTSSAKKLRHLLYRRSKIQQGSPFTQPQATISPENGHGSSRIGVAVQSYQGEKANVLLSYRLAYHDLLDRSAGFIPGAQISFFDVALGSSEQATVYVDHLYLIDAIALAPDNRIFDSWSWNLRLGFDRQPGLKADDGRYFMQGGYGKSFGDPNTLQAYVLASGEVNAGDISDGSSFGLGSEIGAIWQFHHQHKVALSANVMALVNDDTSHHSNISLAWHWAVKRQWGLRAELNSKEWHQSTTDMKVTAYFYY